MVMIVKERDENGRQKKKNKNQRIFFKRTNVKELQNKKLSKRREWPFERRERERKSESVSVAPETSDKKEHRVQ